MTAACTSCGHPIRDGSNDTICVMCATPVVADGSHRTRAARMPRVCSQCGTVLSDTERIICLPCQHQHKSGHAFEVVGEIVIDTSVALSLSEKLEAIRAHTAEMAASGGDLEGYQSKYGARADEYFTRDITELQRLASIETSTSPSPRKKH